MEVMRQDRVRWPSVCFGEYASHSGPPTPALFNLSYGPLFAGLLGARARSLVRARSPGQLHFKSCPRPRVTSLKSAASPELCLLG